MKQQKQNPLRYLWRIRAATWCVVVIERLWPLCLPLILVASLFAAFAWLNVFSVLPDWLHGVLLVLFCLSAFAVSLLLLHFRLPQSREIDRRIEEASGLDFQPLAVQRDRPAANSSPQALLLWQEHQRRMADKLRHLQIGAPYSDIPRHDVHGLRAVVLLLFVIGFAVSFGPEGGRLADAFYFGQRIDAGLLRVDAWVTPPHYTNQPPVYLSRQVMPAGPEVINVPQGSVVTIRLVNSDRRSRLFLENSDRFFRQSLQPEQNMAAAGVVYDVVLRQSATLLLNTPRFNKGWQFRVMPDQSPAVAWLKPPQRAMNGTLELDYEIDDDFGAVKGWASIIANHPDGQKIVRQPLLAAPEVSLVLPRGGRGDGRTMQDLTSHPWAGSDVTMKLVIEDGAGQQAESAPVHLTLPQRSFGNPLARALVEQRRLLAQDMSRRDDIMDMLAALLVRPEATIADSTAVIALQSIWTRLFLARDEDALRHTVAYMWQVALGIENSALSAAEQRLKQAQQALRDALRHGASQEEIGELVDELRQAMEHYIGELAQRGGSEAPQQTGKMQMLDPDSLGKRLQDLENMAKLGNLGAAEQLLSELEKIMNGLHVVPGSGNSLAGRQPDQKNRMQQQMDKLADIMRRQQEMLDKTHRLDEELRRGEKNSGQAGEDMRRLQEEQRRLQSELDSLQRQFGEEEFKLGEGLSDAEKSMENAQEALGRGRGGSAVQNQADALEAMRRGAQNLVEQMREAMKKTGEGKFDDNAGLDPLGRGRGSSKDGLDSAESSLQSGTDVQRARRILDEIRKRLGNFIPQAEKEYLERLLKFN